MQDAHLAFTFLDPQWYRRCQKLSRKAEPLLKAIGWQKQRPLRIVDATAGLGKESFLLAWAGCEVTLFERNPIIAAQLATALAQAQDSVLAPVIARMQLIPACAITTLSHSKLPFVPDVIYCDPMFGVRKKSAAVKKPMQYLQTIVGLDTDGPALIQVALANAKHRVVAKRPTWAAPLYSKPHFTLKGAQICFDVYLV